MPDRKLTRHEIREAAFLILFQMKLNDSSLEEILQSCEESMEIEYTKDSLYIVNGVLEHKEELDSIIDAYSPTRTVDRIAALDLTLLEIALFEIKYNDKVPDKVAINEAIEFAKEYSYKNDSAFINGVLNSYYKENCDV